MYGICLSKRSKKFQNITLKNVKIPEKNIQKIYINSLLSRQLNKCCRLKS